MKKMLASTLLLLGTLSAGCNPDLDVGAACLPQETPCSTDGKSCGYQVTETYLESGSPSCHDACMVHRLDNGTRGSIPANPENVCSAENLESGCVTQAQIQEAVYCTCRCDGPKNAADRCDCPDDFACTQVSDPRTPGETAGYCVRRR